MTVHTPDVGVILYPDMLTQSALADKRPSQVRNFAPVPKDRSWPILPVRERPLSRMKQAPVRVDWG